MTDIEIFGAIVSIMKCCHDVAQQCVKWQAKAKAGVIEYVKLLFDDGKSDWITLLLGDRRPRNRSLPRRFSKLTQVPVSWAHLIRSFVWVSELTKASLGIQAFDGLARLDCNHRFKSTFEFWTKSFENGRLLAVDHPPIRTLLSRMENVKQFNKMKFYLEPILQRFDIVLAIAIQNGSLCRFIRLHFTHDRIKLSTYQPVVMNAKDRHGPQSIRHITTLPRNHSQPSAPSHFHIVFIKFSDSTAKLTV